MAAEDRNTSRKPHALSRRRFLEVAASVAGGPLIARAAGGAPPERLRVPVGQPPSRVVQIQSPYASSRPGVHKALVGEMLEQALISSTQTSTPAQAWRSLLDPQDVIGLKFNRSGGEVIGTSEAVAGILIGSLVEAGWPVDRIVCIEAPASVVQRHGTLPMTTGYDATPTDFGSGSDEFAAVLRQITALIDIPYLKTHNIARMTCALKNLSHGLVKHPARYHGNECSPYIADIVASPLIRSKLRLCIVDALRVMYDGGPDSTVGTISDEGMLLVSVDPVAVETAALGYLNEVRARFQLPPVARSAEEVKYLAEAHRRGLGVAVWHGIDLVRAEL